MIVRFLGVSGQVAINAGVMPCTVRSQIDQ
jgi:hypothetical protein